jgi:integrase
VPIEQKEGNNMARNGDGIFTRKDRPGYWISYQDSDGRRRRRKVEAPNKTKAGELRSGYVSREETAKAHGIRPAGPETFASVAQQYLSHQKARTGAANYQRECGIVEDHLKPFFAGELGAIRKAMIQRYVTARSADVSAASVTKELNVLKHLLKLSVEVWEYIPVNPAHGVKPPKTPPGRLRYLQPGELRAVVEAAPVWLRPIIVLAVATGMRRGEILGLRWLDLDLDGLRILLPQTKNNEGRIVYLNRLAMQALGSLPVATKTTDLIFAGIRPEWVSVAFSRLCRGLKIEDFRFHDLRHTAASWMRMKGADIHTVALLLGHKDLRMAARYQHLSPEFLGAAVARLDGAFELCHQYVTGPKELSAVEAASA